MSKSLFLIQNDFFGFVADQLVEWSRWFVNYNKTHFTIFFVFRMVLGALWVQLP